MTRALGTPASPPTYVPTRPAAELVTPFLPLRLARRRGSDVGAYSGRGVAGVYRSGLASVITIATLVLCATGCGMSQLERHTTAAGILHAGTGIAASVVDQGAREAAAGAGDADELTEALRPWRRAEAVQHLAAAAVDAYVDAVITYAGGDEDETRLARALAGAVSAYAALAELLATLGVDIPPVGRVLAVVGGAL